MYTGLNYFYVIIVRMGVLKIQYASGLNVSGPLKKYLKPSAPYLALLGNTGNPNKTSTAEFLCEASKAYERVFLVLGPKDLEGDPFYVKFHRFHEILQKKSLKNITILNNNVRASNGPFEVLGNAMWSPVYDQKEHSELMVNDTDFVSEKQLYDWSVEDEKDLVTDEKRATILMSYSLCSDSLTNVVNSRHYVHKMSPGPNVRAWLCGAGPFSRSSMVGNTLVAVNNFDSPDFSDSKVLEIDSVFNPELCQEEVQVLA